MSASEGEYSIWPSDSVGQNMLGKVFRGGVCAKKKKKSSGLEMKWRSPHTRDSGSAYSICSELIGLVIPRGGGGGEESRANDEEKS